MQEVFALIRRRRGSAATVLITGETGTGKELVARALHSTARARERPFVAVNCAAIPETLLESELFGHKRGAFTDARTDAPGLFVEADGGTIFLDEIGELPPRAAGQAAARAAGARGPAARRDAQPRRSTCASSPRPTGTWRQRLASGAFREDLYYRLNVVHIQLPPLRERAEDILPLAEHFLAQLRGAARARTCAAFHEAATKALLGYDWPGNVRELENVRRARGGAGRGRR